MKKPLFQEGHELFECPRCEASIVKYRYDFDPNGDLVHWGECDFSMCYTLHDLHYPKVVPDDPISLLVLEDEPKSKDRIVTADEKIEFFHKVIESDKADFPNMTKEDLIYYIICMDHFLQSKKEFDATFSINMRFGVRSEAKAYLKEKDQ